MRFVYLVILLLLSSLSSEARDTLEDLFHGGKVTYSESGLEKSEFLSSFADLKKYTTSYEHLRFDLKVFIPSTYCDSLHSINLGIIYDQDSFYINNRLVGVTGAPGSNRRMVNTNRQYILPSHNIKCGDFNNLTLEVRRLIGGRIGPHWNSVYFDHFHNVESTVIYEDTFQSLHKEISIFLFSLALVLFGLFKGHNEFFHLIRLGIFSAFGGLLSITLSGWLYYFIESPYLLYKFNSVVALGTIVSFLFYLCASKTGTKTKDHLISPKFIQFLCLQTVLFVSAISFIQEQGTVHSFYKCALALLILETSIVIFQSAKTKMKDRPQELTCETIIALGMFSDVLRIFNIHRIPNISTYVIAFGVGSLTFLAVSRLIDKINFSQEAKIATKLSDVARQVAHDIRSPLSALNMVAGVLHEVPEEKRTLLRNATQRINDIANNLLKQNTHTKDVRIETEASDNDSPTVSKCLTMLTASIDAIVSEKRVQYLDRSDIDIEVQYKNAYGLFSKIDPSMFSRVLSNLINNSAEAITKNGKILISLNANRHFAQVSCADNGQGVPPEILKKLGRPGVTYGKEGRGHGLGISYAKKTVELHGGHLEIKSSQGIGTTVSLILPICSPPPWFVEKIDMTNKQTLVSIDDDQTVHHVWRERLMELASKENQIEYLAFLSAEHAEAWWRSDNVQKKRDSIQFLIDYEFSGKPWNGVGVIEKLNCAKNAILVTSHYDDAIVQFQAQEMGVRIIPKGLAHLVPIQILSKERRKLRNESVTEDMSTLS